MTGGEGNPKQCIAISNRDSCDIDETSNIEFPTQVERKAPMHHKRNRHSMCVLTPTSVIVTGSLREVARRECELYSLKTNQWIELPRLENEAYGHSSCAFVQRYIYVFHTSNADDFIERLDLQALDEGWQGV